MLRGGSQRVLSISRYGLALPPQDTGLDERTLTKHGGLFRLHTVVHDVVEEAHVQEGHGGGPKVHHSRPRAKACPDPTGDGEWDEDP